MKKYTDALAKIESKDLVVEAVKVKNEIHELTLGVAMGNTQNYKMISVKKKQFARILGRINEEERNKK
jgi:ribosomal protein L29